MNTEKAGMGTGHNGTVVWHEPCNTVVWVYGDDLGRGVESFLNVSRLPCPYCDGISGYNSVSGMWHIPVRSTSARSSSPDGVLSVIPEVERKVWAPLRSPWGDILPLTDSKVKKFLRLLSR